MGRRPGAAMAAPHTSSPSFSIEELLRHADWLRQLAGHLVRGGPGGSGGPGGQDPEDPLQETWAAALRTPPARDRDPQPWLAEVLRNFVRRRGRSERSRRAREQRFQTLVPAPVATPELLLERAQAQRLLVELVTALAEPFRSTVLLRYFEGLSAADIAQAQEVPAGTVRWRLKEGLDRLRVALDERHAGDRRAWLLLLSPAATVPLRVWKGALTMAMTTTNKKILGAVALLLLVAGGGRLLWPEIFSRAPAPAPVAADRPPSARPPAFLPAIPLPAGEVVHDQSALAGSVEGLVVSALDGKGIAGAELSFSYLESSLPSRTDQQGRFLFAPGDPGRYLLARVSAEGYRAFSPEWGDSPIALSLRPGDRIRGVRLALQPERNCRGQVLDQAGKPVAGASLVTWVPRRPGAVARVSPSSDAGGGFEFPAIEGLTVEAHEGGRVAREHASFVTLQACGKAAAMTLRLGPALDVKETSIAGKVEGPDGQPMAGVGLEAWTNTLFEPQVRYMLGRATSGADGRFTLTPLDPVAYRVTATIASREVAAAQDVAPGTTDLLLRVPGSGRLRGQVRDAVTGAPVPNFSVVLFRKNAIEERLWAGFTRYDGQGAFEIEGLPAGPYRVTVVSEGRAPAEDQRTTVPPDPAAPPELRFALAAGNRVFGTVSDRQTKAPIAGARVSMEGRAGLVSDLPLSGEIISGADGSFELRGLPSGRLSLMVTAQGYHGRVMGGLDIASDGDLGPVLVDLAPTREGEESRIELVGIGVAVGRKGDLIVLGQVYPGGGAAQAGLVPGDAVLAVDGAWVKDAGFESTIQRIRGVEGSVAVLRVRRADGREQEVRVPRALIRAPPR
jgi:RNA polymerase sigma factor (sigma-70 family)